MVCPAPVVIDDTEEEVDSRIEILDDEGGKKGIGILFFKKWKEDDEGFSEKLLDYIVSLDDQGYIDYGMVLKGDISDMDEISMLRKISNYSQAVNNTLFEVDVLPPFYYLAVPVRSRKYAQEVCDIMRTSFNLGSIFFSFPQF